MPKKTRRDTKRPLEIYDYDESGYMRVYYSLDAQITRNLKHGEILTRPVRHNGLWCCTLIPAILFSYTCFFKVSVMYKVMSYLAIGQFCYSILFLTFLYTSTLVLKDNLNGGVAMATFVSTILIYCYSDNGLIFALALSTLSTYTYSLMLRKAIRSCPLTFTVGEAMVVCQGLSLFLYLELTHVYCYRMKPEILKEDDYETTYIKIVVFTVFSTVGLIVTALYFLNDERRNLQNLSLIISLGGLFAFLVLTWNFYLTWIPYFIYFMTYDYTRRSLFGSWLILVVLTVIVLAISTSGKCDQSKASSTARKVFHIIASIVFLSGVLYDVKYLSLAAGAIFGIIILMEALRLSKIDPISSTLQSAFELYSDEKDCGMFAMTPIYLFAGLACPLALVPWRGGRELELLSGVLAIGVGDSAASWFGQHYGKRHWPGGMKTVEGTACNIASQIFFVYVLQLFGVLKTPYCLLRASISATVSALVEGNTVQVDNLVLPLVSLLAFQLTGFLAFLSR